MARTDLSSRELAELDRAIRNAETTSRFEFSVFRGESEGDGADFARSLHASLVAPERSVLLMVDPVRRQIEIVTGADVRRRVDDDQVALAVIAMQSAFAEGDDLGGLTRGIALLADSAH